MKYLLCNTSANAYVIEVTKIYISMKNIKQIDPNETNDMNIMNEIQNNIKQWNHGLNCLQNQTPTESTTKKIQSYTNTNHKYLDHNSNNLNYKTCTIG